MVEPTLNEMVRYVWNTHKRVEGWLERYVNENASIGSPCGCMGPQDGYSVCPCQMEWFIHQNKVKILNEIDPDLALQVMRKQIVKALG